MQDIALPKNFQKLLDEDGGYFNLEKVVNGKVIAKCKLCPNKTITASIQASSNFLSHLKVVHPKAYLQLRQNRAEDQDAATCSWRKRKLEKPLDVYNTGETSSAPDKLLCLVTNFVVSSLSPVSIVEDPGFVQLVTSLSSGVQLPTKKEFREKIISLHQEQKSMIKEKLSSVDYVCVTADCWSSCDRKFFGVTVHWLETDLSRQSAVLTLCRLRGEHTKDTVSLLLSNVFREYALDNKRIVAVLTDTCSNFAKPFEDFGVESKALEDFLKGDESEMETAEQMEHIEIKRLVDSDGNDDPEMQHPKYFRCVDHALNLVALDVPNMIADRKTLQSAFGKCSVLWTRLDCPESAEIILNIAEKSIKGPNLTRWNSTFNAVSCLLEIKTSLQSVCTALQLPPLEKNEIDFLTAYEAVFSPFCSAIDNLRGETDVYMADFFPELLRILKILNEENIQKNKMAKVIADKVVDVLRERFKCLLDFKEDAEAFIVASISHPFFKLRWIPKERLQICKEVFLRFAKSMSADTKSCHLIEAVEMVCKRDDSISKKAKRFGFEEPPDDLLHGPENNVELECVKYYSEDITNLSVLDSYPIVKNLFRKYNTLIPSSAPVERLFNYGSLITRLSRSNTSDDLFESLAVLKCTYAT